MIAACSSCEGQGLACSALEHPRAAVLEFNCDNVGFTCQKAAALITDAEASDRAKAEACWSVADLREDEPVFESAIAALSSLARGSLALRGSATDVLQLIGQRRHYDARRRTKASQVMHRSDSAERYHPCMSRIVQDLIDIIKSQGGPREHKEAACQVMPSKSLSFPAANALLAIQEHLDKPMPGAAQSLRAALLRSSDDERRKGIAYALGRVGGADSIRILRQIVSDRNAPMPLQQTALESNRNDWFRSRGDSCRVTIRRRFGTGSSHVGGRYFEPLIP